MRRYRNITVLAAVLLLMPVYVEAFWHGLSIAQSVFTSLAVNGGPGPLGVTPTSGQDVVRMQCLLNNSTLDPGFTNSYCLSLEPTYGQADYVYDQSGAPFTQAKTTFSALAIYSSGPGAAQRTNINNQQNCYGMGDCWGGVYKIQYAGGDSINGDEGQGFWSDSNINQQNSTDLGTVSSVVRTLCSTTVTPAITGSQTAQTVAVGSSLNCNVGDWIVVDQQVQSNNDIKEAVQITAVNSGGSNRISGIFRNSHLAGATVTSATLFNLSMTGGQGIPGQMRVMVNLSSTPVTAGTVTCIGDATCSGGHNGPSFFGTSTSWSNTMVGGTATNIGCIALDVDSYNDGNNNFKTGTLKSWYQVVSVISTTNLNIFSNSAEGDQAYHGQGPIKPPDQGSLQNPASTYQIRPCVEILRVLNTGGNSIVVAETTATTWNVNDNIEIAISPFPDVYGMLWNFQKFTPGGHQQAALAVNNASNVPMDNGIILVDTGEMFKAANTVGMIDWHSFIPFATGFSCTFCAVGFQVGAATDEAIRLTGGGNGTLFTGSISGNTLNVSAVQQGSLGIGQQVTSSLNATGGIYVNPRTFIIGGAAPNWTIGGPPQTVPSQPMQAGQSNDHSGRIDWNGNYISPNSENLGMTWYGIISGTGGRLDMISNVKLSGSGNLSGLTWGGMFATTKTTFSNLPTCSSSIEGYQVAITDAAGTGGTGYGNTITGGGGTNHVLAYCNGTNWTFH